MLYDREKDTREHATKMLSKLYNSEDCYKYLENFAKDNEERIIEMCHDVD